MTREERLGYESDGREFAVRCCVCGVELVSAPIVPDAEAPAQLKELTRRLVDLRARRMGSVFAWLCERCGAPPGETP